MAEKALGESVVPLDEVSREAPLILVNPDVRAKRTTDAAVEIASSATVAAPAVKTAPVIINYRSLETKELRERADGGNPAAQFQMFRRLSYGLGDVARDQQEADRYAAMFATSIEVEFQVYGAAIAAANGGTISDEHRAMLAKGAKAQNPSNPDAKFHLAQVILHEVATEHALVSDQYKKAGVSFGLPNIRFGMDRFRLGIRLSRLESQDTDAMELIRAAANEELVEAAFYIGDLFDKGKRFTKRVDLAKHYFEIAFKGGHTEAGMRLDAITRLEENNAKSAHHDVTHGFRHQ